MIIPVFFFLELKHEGHGVSFDDNLQLDALWDKVLWQTYILKAKGWEP